MGIKCLFSFCTEPHVVQQLWATICASRVTNAQFSWRISMDLLRKMFSLTSVIHQVTNKYVSVHHYSGQRMYSWLLTSDWFINSGIE